MPKIKVNGQEIEVAPGRKLLEVLLEHQQATKQKETPYYCWHPGLKPHGNCRMCLVKVSNSRKLEVACTYPCTDNLEVTTEGPEIEKARESVLEYMLINHPLDCPICDKAGECMLQDHTYNHRHGVSRFEEPKVLKGTWDLGPNVRIWGNRCISCTRCVRFCEDVAGTGELSLVNRGDHSVADVHPDVPLDNPMSLNVVDICPVGALIDKNFMYQQRVWFAQRKDTICTSCSRGCNVTATVFKEEIKRLQPRHNEAVNGYWMCDHGRLNLAHVRERRLQHRKGTTEQLVAALKGASGRVGVVVGTGNTLEELHLARQLVEAVGGVAGFLTKDQGERWVSKSGFAIETDKTPNRAGAEIVFGSPLVSYREVVSAIDAGKIDVLVVLNQISDLAWPEDLVAAARKVRTVAVADFQASPMSDLAQIVIPVTCWAEKGGTYVNRDGRPQRARPIVSPVPLARPGDKPGTQRSTELVHDIAWLQEVLVALGARGKVLSNDGVLKEAFPHVDAAALARDELASLSAPAPAPTAPTGETAVVNK